MCYLAHFDSLTGLPNRLLFDDALRRTLAEAKQAAGSQFGLLFVDLDRFKQVNDSYGHAIGDLLLREVARRLTGSVREDDLVSRRSGDEFVVLLRALGSAEEAYVIAERVRAAMQQAFELEGRTIAARCSVGAAIYPRDGEDARNLLRRADMAMYRAKAAGGDRSCVTPCS